MTGIKHRLAKLEANAPGPAEAQVAEIHRVIVGETNADGSPMVSIRALGRALNTPLVPPNYC